MKFGFFLMFAASTIGGIYLLANMGLWGNKTPPPQDEPQDTPQDDK